MKTTSLSKIALIAGFVLGCSGSSTTNPVAGEGNGGSGSHAGPNGDGDGDSTTAQGELPGSNQDEFLASYRPTAARAALTHVDSCDALLTSIQNDFLVRAAQVASQLKKDAANQINGTGVGG